MNDAACVHPLSKLKVSIESLKSDCCETCGYQLWYMLELNLKCECGVVSKVSMDADNNHAEWHSFVVQESR